MNYNIVTAAVIILSLASCGGPKATVIGDDTFVFENKVYRIVDNELTELADLNSTEIRKFEIRRPEEKSLGTSSLSFVKAGAAAKLEALYRGNMLYFKLSIENFSDLKDNYYPGNFTIEFIDEFGFILTATEVATSDLIGIVDDSGNVTNYVYNGKTEMSTDLNSEIKTFSVTSSVKAK